MIRATLSHLARRIDALGGKGPTLTARMPETVDDLPPPRFKMVVGPGLTVIVLDVEGTPLPAQAVHKPLCKGGVEIPSQKKDLARPGQGPATLDKPLKETQLGRPKGPRIRIGLIRRVAAFQMNMKETQNRFPARETEFMDAPANPGRSLRRISCRHEKKLFIRRKTGEKGKSAPGLRNRAEMGPGIIKPGGTEVIPEFKEKGLRPHFLEKEDIRADREEGCPEACFLSLRLRVVETVGLIVPAVLLEVVAHVPGRHPDGFRFRPGRSEDQRRQP